MGKYIDGFGFPLPKEKQTEYTVTAAAIRMECAALEYFEAVGDDFAEETRVMA